MASSINYDRRGEMTYDQWAVGEADDAYLYMTRDVHDVLVCERDRVNVDMGRAELEDPYEPPIDH